MLSLRTKQLIGSGVAVAILLFAAFTALMMWLDGGSARPDHGPCVEDFRTLFIAKMDEDLTDPDNFIRRRIENAHWTVKTTSARVTACGVTSVDGSDRAGKDYSNIGDIDCIVSVFWDGVFQKGGYTEIRMTIDGRSGQLKSSAYVGGNAAFNVEQVNWFKVGEIVAPIVVGLVTGGG